MNTPKYAVQVVTDSEDQKADLFETMDEVREFCEKLLKEDVKFNIYVLRMMMTWGPKDQKS
jgi:hypothetical protein